MNSHNVYIILYMERLTTFTRKREFFKIEIIIVFFPWLLCSFRLSTVVGWWSLHFNNNPISLGHNVLRIHTNKSCRNIDYTTLQTFSVIFASAFASIREEMISERAFCVAKINAVRPSYYSVWQCLHNESAEIWPYPLTWSCALGLAPATRSWWTMS